jgi:hypothetical protein
MKAPSRNRSRHPKKVSVDEILRMCYRKFAKDKHTKQAMQSHFRKMSVKKQ